MLFNLLALALPFGQSTFSSLEDHRPLASMAVCVFGLHSFGPYTFLAHSGLVPLESVTMVPVYRNLYLPPGDQGC